MAHHKSAKKRILQTKRRTQVNRARVSEIRTYVRRAEEAIESGDRDAATAALRTAEARLQRGISKGVVHRNTAARKVSRLARRIGAL